MKTYSPNELVNYPIFIQPKMNGINCTLRTDGILMSRTNKYFPAVQAAFHWPRPPFDLYGELYVHGWDLQRIVAAVSPDKPTEDTKYLSLHCFDCNVPYKNPDEKQAIIALQGSSDILSTHHMIVSVPTQKEATNEISKWYNFYLKTGYEGVVIRDSMGQVWKKKPYGDYEYKCVAVTEGKGKRTGHVGHFVLELPDGRTFNCGGGQCSYQLLRKLFEEPPLGKFITVRYNNTSNTGIPLCAQFISVRSDFQ